MANNIGLSFNPFNAFGAMTGLAGSGHEIDTAAYERQSVPTTAREYFNPKPVNFLSFLDTDKKNVISHTPTLPSQETSWNPLAEVEAWEQGMYSLGDNLRNWEWENKEKISGKSPEQRDRLWRNQQFIKQYGLDTFQSLNKEERDEMYLDGLTAKALHSVYGNNENFGQLMQLTPKGRMELLKSGYKSDSALANEDTEKKDRDWLDYSLLERWNAVSSQGSAYGSEGMFYGGVTGGLAGGVGAAAGMGIGGLTGIAYGAIKGLFNPGSAEENHALNRRIENDQLLNKVMVADGERMKEASKDAIDKYTMAYRDAYRDGNLSAAEIDEMFDKVAMNGKREVTDELGNTNEYDYVGSNYYSAFKDSDEFEHFNTWDKLKYLAQTEVLAQKYGRSNAMRVLDNDMQSYVNENQDWLDWSWNTGKNVVVGGIANIANKVVGLGALGAYAFYGEEGLANYLQGKDASGNGEDNAMVLNPSYWNKVDQYNTLDPDAIAKADANGGVSEDNNIVAPGTEGDFWNWNTFNEALKMNKFMWSDLVTNIGLQKLVGTASRIAGGIELAPGMLATESSTVSKVINKLGAAGVMASSSIGIDVAYGMQTFEEVLNQNNEKLDAIITKDTEAEVARRLERPETQKQFRKMVDAENARRKKRAGERGNWIPVDEAQAMEDYVEYLTGQVKKEQEVLHAADRQEALNDAANAYAIDATIEELRMATTNGAFKSYLFDKGTLNALKMNNPYVATTTKNGMYAVGKRAVMKNAIQKFGTNVWGGFQSNYFDDITVGFAEGFGIQEYNNYLLQKYNPAAYGSVMDDYVNPIVAAMAGVRSSSFDKRSFIDGAVGALGTGLTAMPNMPGMFSHKDIMKRAKNAAERDEKAGIKGTNHALSGTEVLSHFINNPLLEAIADAKASARATENEINRANSILKDNEYSFTNMVETLSALNQKQIGRKGTSMLQAEDAKDKEAFTLASSLLSLRNSGVVANAQAEPNKASWSRKKKVAASIQEALAQMLGVNLYGPASSSYTQAMQTLADASAIQEEAADEAQAARQEKLIQTFLGLDANKSITEGMEAAEKDAFARERLKKNADGLLGMMNRIEEVQNRFENSIGATLHPDLKQQLMYQYALDDRWKGRLEELEKKLTGESEHSTFESDIAKYGSMKGYERARKAQEKRVADAEKALEKAEREVKKEAYPNKSVAENYRIKTYRIFLRNIAEENLKKEKTALDRIKGEGTRLQNALEEGQEVIQAENILKLNADDRLRMLDDYYRDDYSVEQQDEIDKAKSLLMQDGTPLGEAMEMVRDAAILNHRIEDNMEAAKRIMQNPVEANQMQQALVENRKRAVLDYFNDKIVAEAFQQFAQDPSSTLSEDAVADKARTMSTAVLKGMQKMVDAELKRERNGEDVSDLTLQNMSDGIGKVLKERDDRSKNVVELDKFLRKTKQVNHTNDLTLAVTNPATGETNTVTQQETVNKEITSNDRLLLYDALDYAVEKGYAVEELPERVDSEEFRSYVEEKNHTKAVEERSNPVSGEYMKGLMQDVLKAYHGNQETIKQATAPKPVAQAPQSVVTPAVEPQVKKEDTDDLRPDDVVASDDPLGIKKKAATQTQQTEQKSARNQEILANGGVLNGHLLGDVEKLLEEIDKMGAPEATKEKLKDIIAAQLASTTLKNIKALQNKVLEDALLTSQEEAPLINVWAGRLANMEVKAKASENNGSNKSNGENREEGSFSPVRINPVSSLESRDLDQLLNYPVWKEYITNHNVVGFLQKFANAFRESWEKKTPLHQSQAVFLYDPALAEQVKASIEGNGGYYNPEISAPVLIALEITDKNKSLVDDESQLVTIKDKADGNTKQYQVIGVMPASEVSTRDSQAMQDTAMRMGAIRNRINWNDTEVHALRYAPANDTGKYNGTIIKTNVEKVESHTEEDSIPHATVETPKVGVQQLMDENAESPVESMVKATDEEKQVYQEAKKGGKLFGVRNTSLYKKMRKAFIDRLFKRERESQNSEDDNNKELNFKLQKGTHDTYPKIVLIREIGKTMDKNSGVPIVDLLRNVDNEGSNAKEVINSNSRFKRLFNQLKSLKLSSSLFDASGNPVNRATYNKTLSDFAGSINKTISNNLHVDSMSVDVQISDGVPADKVINIHVYSGTQAEENRLATLTTSYNGELSEAEYASFLKDLILDAEGNTRAGLRDSRFERVKWQVNYEDATTIHNSDKSSTERSIARTNLEELYDDGIFEMQVTKLAYPARSVQVAINNSMKSKLYTESKAEPETASSVDKVTEQHPVGETMSVTGPVEGDTGMRTGAEVGKPAASNALTRAMEVIKKMISDSIDRKLTDDGLHYSIGGQIWSRVTSIKSTLEGMGERFNPNNAWGLPSSLIGNSFDDFGRDVFNGVFDGVSEAERNEAFKNYDNSTEKNYAESYMALKAFQARLAQKGQAVIATGTQEEPGHITARGMLNVTVNNNGQTETKQVRVAGTLDVLAVDADGNLHIYDFKTSRSEMTAEKAVEKGYDRQLSMYAKFLEEEYGLKVKSINIIPIRAEYPVPSGVDNDGHVIQGAQKTYREARPGSNQLEVKDVTADDSKYQTFTGANFKVEAEIPLVRLSDEKLVASFDKMTNAEKQAIVEAIQDQSETPGEEITRVEDIVSSQPEIEERRDTADEEDGWDVDGELSIFSEESEGNEESPLEEILDAVAPEDENGLLAKMKKLRKDCGGKV